MTQRQIRDRLGKAKSHLYAIQDALIAAREALNGDTND